MYVARPVQSHQSQPSVTQPRYKPVSVSLSSASVPLQTQSQAGTLVLGGGCNILSSGAVLSVDGFTGRPAQHTAADRSCNHITLHYIVNYAVLARFIALVLSCISQRFLTCSVDYYAAFLTSITDILLLFCHAFVSMMFFWLNAL